MQRHNRKLFQLLLAFMFVLTGLVTDIFPLQTTSSFQPPLLRVKAGEGVGRTAGISVMDAAQFGLDSAG